MSAPRALLALLGALVLSVGGYFAVTALTGSSSQTSGAVATSTPTATSPASANPSETTAAPAKSAGPKPVIPTSGTTIIADAEAVQAVCNVSTAQLHVLTGISRGQSEVENLRDGLPLLDQRIVDLQQAAEGRAGLAPVIAGLERLRGDWADALAAHDDGNEATSKRAMAAAAREITLIEGHIAANAHVVAKNCT